MVAVGPVNAPSWMPSKENPRLLRDAKAGKGSLGRNPRACERRAREVASITLFPPVARTNRIKARMPRDFFPIAPAKVPNPELPTAARYRRLRRLASYSTTSSLTFATPLPTMPSDSAAE